MTVLGYKPVTTGTWAPCQQHTRLQTDRLVSYGGAINTSTLTVPGKPHPEPRLNNQVVRTSHQIPDVAHIGRRIAPCGGTVSVPPHCPTGTS